MDAQQQAQRVAEAAKALDVLTEISGILNTGLDRETLSICTSLCESGVNPEALAAVIKELRREAAAAAATATLPPTTTIAPSSSAAAAAAPHAHARALSMSRQ